MSLEVHDLEVKKCFTLWDATFDQEKVESIASKDLSVLPPIVAYNDSEGYHVCIDGIHLLQAAKKNEQETIKGIVIPQEIVEWATENSYELESISQAVYNMLGIDVTCEAAYEEEVEKIKKWLNRMSKQVKYFIKNEKTNEVYFNGEFVEMYDGDEFTLFDTDDEAEQFIHSLDISDVDNEELEVYPIDVYENVWIHYQDFEVIPEEDIIISDEFGVITIRKYHDKAHKAEGYQSDWTGNECYCIVTE